ncbi:MAG: hypothetical protein N2C14_17815 [Planctomycetales bacterium]
MLIHRLCLAGLVGLIAGFELPLQAQDSGPSPDAIRSAVAKAIPLLEKGAMGSAKERTCFTCHNQAAPILALAEARDRGFAIDPDVLARQIQHTRKHLERGRKNYLAGRGQGGKVLTAGYALWAMEAGGAEPDDLTTAVTGFLLQYQKEKDHWSHSGSRPPSSGSDFTTTYVALRGLEVFGSEEQQSQIKTRRKTVRAWLLDAVPRETEDRVFRLLSLKYVGDAEDARRKQADALLEAQRDDGGWSQKDDMPSDAYASATVLDALIREGGAEADDAAIRKGLQYLVDSQLEDGSWRVTTRAKPFQKYYESGFPHGKDQFISITATSWAVQALLSAVPDSP